MPNFCSLSEDILRLVITISPPNTIRRCEQVCRLLRRIIRADIHIQYLLELDICGYVEPVNPRLDLSYSEKREILRGHRSRLDHPESISPEIYELHIGESSFSSVYTGGVYVRGVRIPGSYPITTRQLYFYQLPSSNRGVEYRHWMFSDLGADIRMFAIDPEQDLLVLLEVNHVYQTEGTYKLHLRSMSTNGSHPKASPDSSFLVYQSGPILVQAHSFYLEISGSLLAVVFRSKNDLPPRATPSYVVIWDWNTGIELTRVATSGYHSSFTLLSEDSLLLPRCVEPYRPRNDIPEGEFGFLDVYRFNSRATESTLPTRVASFVLPVLSYGQRFESTIYLGCAPTTRTSKALASSAYSPNAFELAPQNCLLYLDIFTSNRSMAGFPRSVTDLCIPSSVILGALPSDQEYTVVPWVDWAGKTSCVDTDELGSPHKRSGFGQRMAGFEHGSFSSEPKLVVLDFDEQRIKARIMSDTQTIWEVCTPSADKHERIRDAVFCGRGDLATRKYMRAVFPVREQVEEGDKVMIDEERVVIETGHSREKLSLLVYSF